MITIGTVGSSFWPSHDLHEHATGERIGQILDSLATERTDTTTAVENTLSEPVRSNNAPTPKTTRRIDINTATLVQLQTLPGIGPAMAKRILEARKNRRFLCSEDLLLVKGIGEKKFNKLLPFVKVP